MKTIYSITCKNRILISITAFLFSAFTIQAQIDVITGGNVGIGIASPTASLHVVTAATTGNGFLMNANTVTTGLGFSLTANGLTTGSGFSLSSTSTAGTGSNSSKLFNIARSGANANSSHTAYGLYSAVTNTGTTSTNVGGYFSASGATNNYGLIIANGSVGIGTSSPANNLQIGATSPVSTATPITLSLGGTYSNSAGANLKLKLYDDNVAGNAYGIGVSAGSMDFDVSSSASYNWYIGGAFKMILNTSGNVGIGTTSPGYKLEVSGDDINVLSSGKGYRIQGNKVLWYNTTTTSNIFAGVGAGASVSSGTNNSFFGYQSGYSNTVGTYNTFIGYQAGLGNTYAGNNVAVGWQALKTQSYGSFSWASKNVAIGDYALYLNQPTSTTTGNQNTAVGFGSGATITIGTSNTCIGYNADVTAGTYTNSATFGNGALTNASDKIVIGNTFATIVIGGQTGWQTFSDGRFKINVKEEVKGLEFITKLRPVNYQLDTKTFQEYLTQNMSDSMKHVHNDGIDFAPSTSVVRTGFIAQEVEQAAQSCGYTFDGVHVPIDNNDNYSLGYGSFVVPLVKAVQELNSTVDSLKSRQKTTDSLLTALIDCCSIGLNKNASGSNNSGTQLNPITIYELELANISVLFQNFPNPFGTGTTIKYFVPDNSNALIMFYDEFGNTLKEFSVTEKGMGQLNIATLNLSAGVYSYSLIVNGKIVDTKKMVKTN